MLKLHTNHFISIIIWWFLINENYYFTEPQLSPTLNVEKTIYKVRENEDVTFVIPFSGTPTPEIEWFISNTVVKNDSRKKKTTNDEAATLTIKKVVDDDAGEYTIKAKSPVGDVEANIKLIIMSKLFVRPHISRTKPIKTLYFLDSHRTTCGTRETSAI